MRIAVVSYSNTGNNLALANLVAAELAAKHIRVKPARPLTTFGILLDMALNRTPGVDPSPAQLAQYERVLFIAPVWCGLAASPLRSYFTQLKAHPLPYAYACVSGGADGGNPKLAADLEKRTGAAPAALADLHIADLLPKEPKPTRKDTSNYRISAEQAKALAQEVLRAVSPLTV